MSVNPDLVELTKSLEKAVVIVPADGATNPVERYTDAERAIDILQALARIERVTADELRMTKVGLIVGKLSKSTLSPAIAKQAKELLAKWKSMVGIAPSTPVELAKANSAAMKTKTSSTANATPAPKKEESKKDDTSSDSKKRKEKEKDDSSSESDRDSKKRKTSSPATVPTTKSSSTSSSAPTAASGEFDPELRKGPFGLFNTDDSVRNKMQLMLYNALGDPPAAVQEVMKNAGAGVDLSAFKSTKTSSPPINPSPSPPPIGDIHLSDNSPAGTAPHPAGTAAPPSTTVGHPAGVALPSSQTFHSRVELAYRIEAAMFDAFKDAQSAKYRQKYRDLAPQLRDPNNEELNVALYLGRITPEQLVKMTLAELAPSSLKEKREKEAAYAREAARSDIGMDAGATDIFQCDVCKERKCTYFQMQTRGADEPMTIFVTCLVCGNKFRSGDGER